MMLRIITFFLFLVITLSSIGCGVKGSPLPPEGSSDSSMDDDEAFD